MSDFIKECRDRWEGDPAGLLDEYDYHPELTKELDNLDAEKLNYEMLYKIVLWN